MNASEFFKAGKLQEAIDAQIQLVKAKPADQDQRVFLFELLSFAGDLERAQRQIDAVNYGEAQRDTAVAAYRKILDSERVRRRVFHDGIKPDFLGDPPEYVLWRLEALNCLRAGQPEGVELLQRSDQAVPAVKGQLNGKPFETLRDADDLFGNLLEVFAHGKYFWVPLEHVESLAMNAPSAPRDLLWIPARLEMRDGQAGDVFLPALYPGSHEQVDDQVKLGRLTDWKEAGSGPVRGVGLRTFLCGEDAVSILEWRELQMNEEISN